MLLHVSAFDVLCKRVTREGYAVFVEKGALGSAFFFAMKGALRL